MRQIADRKYQKAFDLLRSAGLHPQVKNAMGACLLRLGRYQEAIPILRSIVLTPGCTWMRPNVPTVYQTNYATALLLSGRPSGCDEILAEIDNPTDPGVQRLTAAIDRWVHSLTFWQKLNWRVGRIEPKHCQVPLDFEPGDFETDPVLGNAPSGNAPNHPAPDPAPKTAA